MRCVYYVFSAHWDREWYQTFQDYRYRLVQMIDRILDGWNTGRLLGPFQTDGQSILLEDYLEVRPQAAEEVTRRVKEGRFVLGPFYVQPDEFIVSGESLIRNLRLGRLVARRLGACPPTPVFCATISATTARCHKFLPDSASRWVSSGVGRT